MAQYKVLQDIEAEDKLLGPLSLRQFIYAAITIALGFVAFRLFMTPAWFLGFIFVLPALFFGMLAAPLGGQQSSEIWLLAKIRFFLKPRKRIWDQTGLQQLVTITAPKKIEKQLTKGYSEDEVKSRLKTLSTTLDTRGWAVKNATNLYATQGATSDRLFDIATQDAPAISAEATADMLDPSTNPRAQAMDQMISKSAEEHRQIIDENVKKYALEAKAQAPKITEKDETDLLNKIHERANQPTELGSHMKTIQPFSAQQHTNIKKQGQAPVTPATDPAILKLVENSDGLSVRTVAREAERLKQREDDDEVVISLH